MKGLHCKSVPWLGKEEIFHRASLKHGVFPSIFYQSLDSPGDPNSK